MRQIIAKLFATLIVGILAVVLTVNVHGTNYQDQSSPTFEQMGEKAVTVIKKKRTESLNGYLLILCKAASWKDMEKDSDLGPFLKYKKAAANLDAIVAMPPSAKEGSTYGVYFQDHKPIGVVEIKTGKGEKITEANVGKAYVSVEDSDQGNTGQIRFEKVEVYSDDDKPIPALQVVSDGAKLLTADVYRQASLPRQ